MTSVFETLVKTGVKDINTCFRTALLCAVRRDDLNSVALLLEKGDATMTARALEEVGRNGDNAMLQLLSEERSKWPQFEKPKEVNELHFYYLHAIQGAAAGG
jgi:ankyrin repeat protein